MATQAKGSAAQTLLDFESTYGTANDAANRLCFNLPFNSNEVAGNRAQNQSQTLRGDRNPTAPFSGNKNVAGPLTGPVDTRIFPLILKSAIGTPTRTEVPLSANDIKTSTPTITISSGAYTFSAAQTDAGVDVGARVIYTSGGTTYVGIITVKTNTTTGTIKNALQSGSNPADVTGATVVAIIASKVNATPGTLTISSGVGTFSSAPTTLSVGDMIEYGAAGSTVIVKVTVVTSSTVYTLEKLNGHVPADAATQAVQFCGAASYWKQTFKVHATNDTPSFTLERGYPDLDTPSYDRYVGCKIGSVELSVGGDGELTYNAAVVGAASSIETSALDATVSAADLYNTRFENLHATMKEGGSTSNVVRNFNLNFSDNLDEDQYVIGGAGKRRSLPAGIAGVGGSISAVFEDTALQTKADQKTVSSLDLTLTNGSEILRIYAPEVEYAQNSPAVSGPGGVVLDLNFQGMKTSSNAESSAIVVEVTGPYAAAV